MASKAAKTTTKPALALVPAVEQPANDRMYNRSVSINWVALRAAMKAALVVCSTDDSRLALNSILVEVSTTSIRLVATDGHRLIRIDVAGAESSGKFSVQLTRESAMAWVKLTPPKIEGYKVELAAAKVGSVECMAISSSFGSTVMSSVDAQFPPYDQVIPTFDKSRKPAAAIAINAQYLGDIGAIGKQLTSDRTGRVELRLGTSDLDPIRLDIENPVGGFEATYVVMPMRL